MKQLWCCMKKDSIEFIRKKRGAAFSSVLILISAMVLISSVILPVLADQLARQVPDMTEGGEQLQAVLAKLFPPTMKENIGIWSSDVGVFFTPVVLFMCAPLLREERRTGKWILALEAGYRPQTLLVSKILIYGLGASIPVFIMYNLYYTVGSLVLSNNFRQIHAAANGSVLAYAVFSILNLVIALSVLCKNQASLVIAILAAVTAGPDVLAMFPFGKFLPTYVLTFAYRSSSSWQDLAIPALGLLFLQLLMDWLAVGSVKRFRN